MKAFVLTLAVLTLPMAAAAQDALYKWTDKQGVTHYSQLPPEDREFEERRVKARDPKDPQPATSTTKEPTGAELRKQACETARKNVETLKSAKQVWVEDPVAAGAAGAAGAEPAKAKPAQQTLLSDAQRAEEMKRAESQIHIFCDN